MTAAQVVRVCARILDTSRTSSTKPPLRASMTATVTIDIGRERGPADVFTGEVARPRPTG